MFCYNLYGKHVATNVRLPLLSDITEYGKIDLEVHVSFEAIAGDTISIKEADNCCMINLASLASYYVDSSKDIIICKARDFEAFFSTFFNIPFSVYCLCKNEVIYHACSLVYDDKVFCLAGNKGAGKSTVMQILTSSNDFGIFGDDTIHIDCNSMSDGAHNLIKHTLQTVEALKLKTLNIKNAAGKYYSSFDPYLVHAKISKIFHIVRYDGEAFNLEPINNTLIKNNIYKTNIVGIDYLPHSLMAKAIKVKPDSNIEFYKLNIPNDLDYLIRESEKLKELILRSFKMGEDL